MYAPLLAPSVMHEAAFKLTDLGGGKVEEIMTYPDPHLYPPVLVTTLIFTANILPTLTNNMKYLVFGGGGQVALHFAKTAIAKGHEVISVVRDDSQYATHPIFPGDN
jgi:hypothetical protein